jgi:hypothetical protein
MEKLENFTPINNFIVNLNDVSILREYSFYELYPGHYIDFSDKLKNEIINNLTKLSENRFGVYLKYVKENIEEYHVYDPEECIIQKWLDDFNFEKEDFPFLLSEEIKMLISPKYDDVSLEKEQKWLNYSIQREFHLYAVFLEFQKIIAFIDELLSKEIGSISKDIKSDIPLVDKPDYKNEIWFKVGLLFAEGKMDRYYYDKKPGFKDKYTAPKVAEELGNSDFNKIILATISNYDKNNSNANKNIFNSRDKMQKIIVHCKEKNIPVIPYFISRLPAE